MLIKELNIDELKFLISHSDDGDVSSMEPHEFDPKHHYKEIFTAVEKAGDGKARVFRVQGKGTRVEYWVVGVDKQGGRVVGFKAGAVES